MVIAAARMERTGALKCVLGVASILIIENTSTTPPHYNRTYKGGRQPYASCRHSKLTTCTADDRKRKGRVRVTPRMIKNVLMKQSGLNLIQQFFLIFFFYFEFLPWADFSVLYKVPVFRSTQQYNIVFLLIYYSDGGMNIYDMLQYRCGSFVSSEMVMMRCINALNFLR